MYSSLFLLSLYTCHCSSDEKEILLPPLLAVELLDMHEEVDGTIVCEMALNCNLQSKTIEDVLAFRQKQVLELADVVQRGLRQDIMREHSDTTFRYCEILRERERILQEAATNIKRADADIYNDNERFTTEMKKLLDLVPKPGMEIGRLAGHLSAVRSVPAGEETPLPKRLRSGQATS